MSERKPFEIKVGDRELAIEAGKLVCVLFRKQQEVAYLAINITPEDEEETTVLRIFNNVEVVRKIAGLAIHPDGLGISTDESDTFYDQHGWYSPVVIKEEPTAEELDWFMEVNLDGLDTEWAEME